MAAMKMLTAQNIIDAAITQSTQGGSGADGIKIPQTKEELELVQALAAKAQHDKLEEMKAAAAAAQSPRQRPAALTARSRPPVSSKVPTDRHASVRATGIGGAA